MISTFHAALASKRRLPQRLQLPAELFVLEQRCMPSSGSLGGRMDMAAERGGESASAHSPATAEPFWWHTSNVTVGRHPAGVATVEVSWLYSGNKPWDAIYGQSGISLQAGATYEIHIVGTLLSGSNSTFKVSLQHAKEPYTSYFNEEFSQGSYTRRVTVPRSDSDASLQFQFGGHGARKFVAVLSLSKV